MRQQGAKWQYIKTTQACVWQLQTRHFVNIVGVYKSHSLTYIVLSIRCVRRTKAFPCLPVKADDFLMNIHQSKTNVNLCFFDDVTY